MNLKILLLNIKKEIWLRKKIVARSGLEPETLGYEPNELPVFPPRSLVVQR